MGVPDRPIGIMVHSIGGRCMFDTGEGSPGVRGEGRPQAAGWPVASLWAPAGRAWPAALVTRQHALRDHGRRGTHLEHRLDQRQTRDRQLERQPDLHLDRQGVAVPCRHTRSVQQGNRRLVDQAAAAGASSPATWSAVNCRCRRRSRCCISSPVRRCCRADRCRCSPPARRTPDASNGWRIIYPASSNSSRYVNIRADIQDGGVKITTFVPLQFKKRGIK